VVAAVRACRIMRLTNYFQSLEILSVSIIRSFKHIIRLVLFLLAFLLLAGSLSVRFFKSSTYECTLPLYTTKIDCQNGDGDWLNVLGVGFDNILESMFNMFAVVTADGWPSIMNVAMSSRGVDIAIDSSSLNVWGFFFLLVFFFGHFIFINIFVGVLVEKMQSVNHEYDKCNFIYNLV
jgi:cation channel sperm-associated protein 2